MTDELQPGRDPEQATVTTFATPDVTKAQIIAIVQPVITAAAAFGLPLTEAQQIALLGLAGAVSGAIAIADAIIRKGRATGSSRRNY